jgi:hypothetical protein
LIELEALRLGVMWKAAGWDTLLRAVADRNERVDQARLEALLDRARR